MKALREMKKILDCFIDCCNGEGEKGLNRPCHLSFDMITCEFGIKKRSGKRTGQCSLLNQQKHFRTAVRQPPTVSIFRWAVIGAKFFK